MAKACFLSYGLETAFAHAQPRPAGLPTPLAELARASSHSTSRLNPMTGSKILSSHGAQPFDTLSQQGVLWEQQKSGGVALGRCIGSAKRGSRLTGTSISLTLSSKSPRRCWRCKSAAENYFSHCRREHFDEGHLTNADISSSPSLPAKAGESLISPSIRDQNPNFDPWWLGLTNPDLDPQLGSQLQESLHGDKPETGFSLHRSVALASAVAILATAVSASFAGTANAATPHRNKLREERLAWEKSQQSKGSAQKKSASKGGAILGGLVNVSELPEGPAKVDIDVAQGAKFVRRKLYKARYFTEEALEDFRNTYRRARYVRYRPQNLFQRNREFASMIQLGLILIVLVFTFRWISDVAKRNRWGWAEWYKRRPPKSGTRIRDRSLGGREVAVGNQWEWPSWLWGGKEKIRRQTLGGVRKGAAVIETVKHANPLDYEVDLRSEKEIRLAKLRQEERRAALERRKQVEELPGWWPREALLPPVKIAEARKEIGRREAQATLQRLVNMRVVGKDPTLEDIIDLHETCQRYDVSVTFDAASTQESIYRVAVQHKLAQLMRAARYDVIETSVRPATARFVGLLAKDLGISQRRAVDLVESMIAAKTKASFTQAYALLKQGRSKELAEELSGLALILATFPLPLDSAKLELVGDGLSARISSAEREQLLKGTCAVIRQKLGAPAAENGDGGSHGLEEIAARALGLTVL